MALPGAFDGLLGESVWVAWNDEGGRKVPKSPSGGNAKSNDPSTWGTYAEAQAAASRNGYSGVGIMLSDGLVGIDLDGAVSDGVIADWAQQIVDLVGSYTEVSPSGTGLHILAWADMDVVGAIGSADHAAGIEVYNNRRYFTVTGDAVNDEPIHDLTQEMSGILSRLLPGRSSEERVRAAVGSLAADEVKRLANRTMTDNCARDGKRYARVPTGAETCEFCIMLASRGFVYHSRETAGEFDHYHRSCDCKVIGDLDELTEVEGYDPDAYYDLWKESTRLRESGMPVAQREAILAAMRDRLMPQSYTSQAALAALYGAGLDSAWAEFRRLGKTADAYQRTVGAYLSELGSACGGRFSADFMARPDGDEIWAALRLLSVAGSVRFRCATAEHKSPDFLVDGVLLELKTPQSERKVTRRLLEISRQFEGYPDEPRAGALSLLNLSVEVDSVVGVAQRFVDDGTLDTVYVIPKSGEVKRVER